MNTCELCEREGYSDFVVGCDPATTFCEQCAEQASVALGDVKQCIECDRYGLRHGPDFADPADNVCTMCRPAPMSQEDMDDEREDAAVRQGESDRGW